MQLKIRLGVGPFAAVVLALLVAACSTAPSPKPAPRYQEVGRASYYAHKFHGRRTASGERYNQNAMTAAHRSLAFGTIVQVKNVENGRSVQVRINDRGPFIRGRIIDVSYAAAKQLGMVREGVVKVKLVVVR